MGEKPKVAICWLGACGGCDEAVVDLNEAILRVADAVEIVLWPVALDFGYSRIEAMADSSIAVSIISGSVRNSEHLELAHLLRKKSALVLAFGSCACLGGTPGLANLRTREDILNWVYRDAPTVVNPDGRFPQVETKGEAGVLHLPEFFDHVYTLDQVIPVDYYLPGCPPPVDLIENAINSVISEDLPPRGSTLAPRRALCDTCARNQTKPARLEITKVRRIHEIEADPEACFMAQGVICLGPATRGGCGETCIKVNTPCRGCFGPVPGVDDSGARYLSTLSALFTVEAGEDLDTAMESIVDPVGYLYRFSQPQSILGRKTVPHQEG